MLFQMIGFWFLYFKMVLLWFSYFGLKNVKFIIIPEIFNSFFTGLIKLSFYRFSPYLSGLAKFDVRTSRFAVLASKSFVSSIRSFVLQIKTLLRSSISFVLPIKSFISWLRSFVLLMISFVRASRSFLLQRKSFVSIPISAFILGYEGRNDCADWLIVITDGNSVASVLLWVLI